MLRLLTKKEHAVDPLSLILGASPGGISWWLERLVSEGTIMEEQRGNQLYYRRPALQPVE